MGTKVDHPTLFECKCEHHPSGAKAKNSWFGKKQSSAMGSRRVDQGRYRKADFKNVNSACPKDYYPLPEIDIKIEAVMGFPFKCFLDAYKGYHQIQMAKEDKEKTAFYTDQGTYCYTKMPFGLKNPGATYQSLINLAFQAQLGRNLEAYVDDMVIKSKTEQEMIMDIAKTFDNLRKVNMKLNLKKLNPKKFPFKCFLDAYKGYHQIQMAKEDEEKTTFYTDQGTYCYTKMPFGLKNAGATYQRLIDSTFQAQLGRNLEAYVDDMVIKSKMEQEMIMDIAKTFDNLRKVNMKLTKCK
ncbi:reverse transcriptase domain-containing protein, partial [Tanacetum coccineum]